MTAVSPGTPRRKLVTDAFNLYGDEETGHVFYEADSDLMMQAKEATRGGTLAGLVLVELGIDGYRAHRVRAEARRWPHEDDPHEFTYEGDRLAALDDAIEALTAIRDQLAVMRTPEEARVVEHNAVEIGADAQRLGMLNTGERKVS